MQWDINGTSLLLAEAMLGNSSDDLNVMGTKDQLTMMEDDSLNSSLLSLNSTLNSSLGMMNLSSQFIFAQKCLNFFNFYYLALIIVFGMVGNTLNFLVFTRTHLRLRSSSYYLAALALADLGFLLTLLIVWLNHVGINLFNRQGFCQAMVYGSSVCSCLSVWLTVAFTFERLIAVQYPLQRPFMCTVHRAKVIIGVLTVVTFLVHVYSLFAAGITEGENGAFVCDLLPDYYKFMHVVNLVDTVVTLVIPLILILVMNSLIAKNLFVFSRIFKKPPTSRSGTENIQMTNLRMSDCNKWPERDSGQGSVSNPSSVHSQQHSGASGGSGRHHHHRHSTHHHRQHSQPRNSQAGVPLVPATVTNGNHRAANSSATLQTTGAAVIMVAHEHHSSSASGGSQNHQVIMAVHQEHDASGGEQQQQFSQKLQYRNILSIRIQYSITKMLLLISSVFILLNLPSYVIRLQVFVSDVMATGGTETSPTAWLLQQFFMLLYYTNFSINFLLYSTCGATFRHCLCRLLRDKVDTLRRIWLRLRSCPRMPALFVAPTTVPSPLQEQELQLNDCQVAEPEIRQQ